MIRKLYRVPEAAEMLGVSQKLIWKMVGAREIDVVRLGRAVRIPGDSLETLISESTTPARSIVRRVAPAQSP